MAYRYFADLDNGETLMFSDRKDRIWNKNQSSKHDDTWAWNGERWVKITRAIDYKSFPSLHKCDARCENARGFKCECSCGGKNHGKSAFICNAA